MTRNQLEWLTIQETKRSNLAKEAETSRSNRANEQITRTRDDRTHQTNLIRLGEDQRHNLATELETNRSNIAREQENFRSNLAKESENVRSNLAKEAETNRANLVKEAQAWENLFETNRHNVQNEAISSYANSLTARNIAVQANEAASRNAQREVQNVKTAMETLYIPKDYNLQQQKQDFYEQYATEVEAPLKQMELRRIDKDIDRLIAQTTLNKATAKKTHTEIDRLVADTKKAKAETHLARSKVALNWLAAADKVVDLFK